MNQLGQRSRSRGQTSTEYMLIISVVVIAVVGSAYVFVEPYKSGVQELAKYVYMLLAFGM